MESLIPVKKRINEKKNHSATKQSSLAFSEDVSGKIVMMHALVHSPSIS
jgi:hypothetical protein